jgi:hypothetical protein
MRSKHEYHEGPRAGENFKRLATALLQKPKNVVAPKKQAKVKPAGKKQG